MSSKNSVMQYQKSHQIPYISKVYILASLSELVTPDPSRRQKNKLTIIFQ